jgi:hypothetical protein
VLSDSFTRPTGPMGNVTLVDPARLVRMRARLVGCDVDAITGGIGIRVVFVPRSDGITVPMFSPSRRRVNDSGRPH